MVHQHLIYDAIVVKFEGAKKMKIKVCKCRYPDEGRRMHNGAIKCKNCGGFTIMPRKSAK